MSKSFTTALAIILPESSWPQINAIRSKHDKAYPRWMPHVNLLFPFVPRAQFDDAARRLQTAFQENGVKPFTLDFSVVGSFPHGNVHVAPTIVGGGDTNAMNKIFQIASETFADASLSTRSDFHPHMTLGQWPKQELAKHVAKLQQEWQSIRFECTEVVMIARVGDEPFEIVKRISFAKDQALTAVEKTAVNKTEGDKTAVDKTEGETMVDATSTTETLATSASNAHTTTVTAQTSLEN